jgi:hypothetical protein
VAAPGWYPDPSGQRGPNGRRYWDGQRWLDAVPPSPKRGPSPRWVWTLVGVGLLLVVYIGGSAWVGMNVEPDEPDNPLLSTPSVSSRSLRGLVEERSWPGEWPLTVPGGRLGCSPVGANGMDAVTFTVGDRVYAVNGAAQTVYPPIDPIWRTQPGVEGVRVNIGELLDVGLSLCD